MVKAGDSKSNYLIVRLPLPKTLLRRGTYAPYKRHTRPFFEAAVRRQIADIQWGRQPKLKRIIVYWGAVTIEGVPHRSIVRLIEETLVTAGVPLVMGAQPQVEEERYGTGDGRIDVWIDRVV